MNCNTRVSLFVLIVLTLTIISCKNDDKSINTTSPNILENPSNDILIRVDSCNTKTDLSLAAMNEQIVGTWRLIGLRCKSNILHHSATLYIYKDKHYTMRINDVNIAYGTWQITKDSIASYTFTTSYYLRRYLGDELKLCGDELTLYPHDDNGCLAYYKRD